MRTAKQQEAEMIKNSGLLVCVVAIPAWLVSMSGLVGVAVFALGVAVTLAGYFRAKRVAGH